MTRKIAFPLVCALACLCLPLNAQDKDASARLTAAHALYYTPTASGLQSFHCDVAIDWKSMLTRLSGNEIPDDNPSLKFLQAVHLSVTDELKGKGSLLWTTVGDPPADKEDAIKQIRDGLQTSVAGFFDSWNAFMNGGMVPLPDSTVTVSKSGEGVHLSGKSNDATLDEDFDKNMLLTKALVASPNFRVVATPTYVSTPDGLVISTVSSEVHQPPDAAPAEAIFHIDYANVDKFQIPSRVTFDIKNSASIEIGFTSCQVSVADLSKKPASR